MNCYIVVLRCSLDDLIIGVEADEEAAARLVRSVNENHEPYLAAANTLYKLDASEVIAVSVVVMKAGKVVEVRHESDLDEPDTILLPATS